MADEQIKIRIQADAEQFKVVSAAVERALGDIGKQADITAGKIRGAGNTVKSANQNWTNLALVIQDLPYGFRGIQNNLPALASGIANLAGPAYFAFSALVAAVTAYDMGIFGAKEKTDDFNKSIAETNNQLRGAVNYMNADIAQLNSLLSVTSNLNYTERERKQALNDIKDIIGKVNKVEAEKIKNTGTATWAIIKYTEALKQQQLVEVTSKKIAELQVGILEKRGKLDIARSKANRNMPSQFLQAFLGYPDIQSAEEDVLNAETLLRKLEKMNESALVAAGKNQFLNPAKEIKPEDTFSANLRKENNAILNEIKKREELLKRYKGGFIIEDSPQEKANAERKRKSDLKTFADYKMTGEFGKSLEGAKSSFFESLNPDQRDAENEALVNRNKLLKDQADAYLQLANTVSNFATNAFMGLWSAMEQGASIGEALKVMFIDLVKQIAAAAVKALVFTAVLNLLPTEGPMAAATALSKKSAGGVGGLFKYFMGFANGGIVSGPTMGLIGEYPGAKSNPEVVAPLNKLKDLMADSGGGGEFIIRGQDLVLAMNRSETALKYRRG
jgi:hypothetical protein